MEEAAGVIAQPRPTRRRRLAAAAPRPRRPRQWPDSQRIQSAAAPGAVRALITAGLVEEVAATRRSRR